MIVVRQTSMTGASMQPVSPARRGPSATAAPRGVAGRGGPGAPSAAAPGPPPARVALGDDIAAAMTWSDRQICSGLQAHAAPDMVPKTREAVRLCVFRDDSDLISRVVGT